VEYSLAAKGRVRLSVYNVAGQLVRDLVNQIQSPGKYSASWDGRNQKEYKVPSGVYFYRLQTETFSDTKKAVVVR
jgi:flagellar hook assembly protein FlgD